MNRHIDIARSCNRLNHLLSSNTRYSSQDSFLVLSNARSPSAKAQQRKQSSVYFTKKRFVLNSIPEERIQTGPMVEICDGEDGGQLSSLSSLDWSDSEEVEKNEDIVRQAAVLSAAAMWIANTAVASQTTAEAVQVEQVEDAEEKSFEEKYRENCKSTDQCVDEGTEKYAGCSVGVYLVRSDGFSCAREQVTGGIFRHTQPSTEQLLVMWESPPKIVFLLKKLGKALLPELLQVARILAMEESVILVEAAVMEEILEAQQDGTEQDLHEIIDHIQVYDPSYNIDLITCLGGDGVILHASSIFQGPCPPLLGFNLGSMGFLAPHAFTEMGIALKEAMMLTEPPEDILSEREKFIPCDGIPITLRMRIHCELWSNNQKIPGSKEFEILNELCIDRGPSSFLSMIECYEITRDDELRLLTKVQADGLIVSTATGSTAYSVSAGGSMVHPSVPCILVTPICPHSLSFRPVVLPDSARLLLRVPEDARSTAWVCFDGKSRQEIKRGDGIYVCMSEYPVATVNWGDQMSEFVGSLIRCLNWNDREEQKPLEEAKSSSKSMIV